MPRERLPLRRIRDVPRLRASNMSRRRIAVGLNIGRSVTISTARGAPAWFGRCPKPTFTDAILDRIVHNAHRLDLDGPSMRKIKAAENEPAIIDQTQGK